MHIHTTHTSERPMTQVIGKCFRLPPEIDGTANPVVASGLTGCIVEAATGAVADVGGRGGVGACAGDPQSTGVLLSTVRDPTGTGTA